MRHLSLTSVDPVSRDVGVRAARLLLERMDNPSLPQRTEVLYPVLVLRNSTAPAFKN
jgi:DNA-binding LacI/PurR family transcriptional regulator